jgi:peptide/nickel transport system ATP-binding protein
VNAPLLEVRDLNVWFNPHDGSRVHAVRDVSFTLDEAERAGLVGESGCGKSTTVLALLGLLPPTAQVSGEVLLNGTDIMAEGEASVGSARWTEMAMVFQSAMNAFNPVRRVGSPIAEVLRVRAKLSKQAAADRTRELFEMVGIPPDRVRRYPHEFSGGMRQRAAIALALACEPKVLLADEPTTALDVMVQAQIVQLLRGLCDQQGLALLMVSHDLPLIAQVCSDLNVMYAGEIIERGPVADLYRTPAHPYSRMLLAATPDIMDVTELISIKGAPPLLSRTITGCAFRPRCDRALGRCETETPVLKTVGENRMAACHLNDKVPSAVPLKVNP